jgi:hypothetical protein
VEVSGKKLDKVTLETCWIFLVLKCLPTSFGTFRTLQYAGMKKPNTPLSMSSFLKDLKNKLRRQQEAENKAVPSSFTAPTALAVSQTQPQNSSQSKSNARKNRPRCENGTHNPSVTSHSEENCHVAHPDKAVAYYQAAMDRASAHLGNKAMLSAYSGIADAIILDRGATAHYLKHWSYFTSLKDCSSTVFGANGASIPIIGEGPEVIPSAAAPSKYPWHTLCPIYPILCSLSRITSDWGTLYFPTNPEFGSLARKEITPSALAPPSSRSSSLTY